MYTYLIGITSIPSSSLGFSLHHSNTLIYSVAPMHNNRATTELSTEYNKLKSGWGAETMFLVLRSLKTFGIRLTFCPQHLQGTWTGLPIAHGRLRPISVMSRWHLHRV
jgi:hypothetical protein